MENGKIIEKLLSLEAMAAVIQRDSCKLREELEGIYPLTPRKGKGLTTDQLNKIKVRTQKRHLKRAI